MDFTKCQVCGTEVPKSMMFCSSCGNPIDHEAAVAVAPEKTRAGISLKKLLIPAIALIVVVAAVIVGLTMFKPSKYEYRKGSLYISSNEDSVIIIPHNKAKVEIDGYLRTGYRSLDGIKAAQLIAEDGDDWDTLLYITDKIQTISDGVHSVWLASSGNAFAYAAEYNNSDNTAELWLYSDGKSKMLSDEFSVSSYNCTISPDGKSLAYVTFDGEEYTCVVTDGKTVVKLGKDITPVGVADGAKYIYYNKSGTLYVQTGISGDVKEKLGDDANNIYANKDLSQVFYTSNSKSYVSINGGKKQALTGSRSYLVVPSGTAFFSDSNITICGITSFANTFYCNSDNALIYINGKYETSRIAKNVDDAYLATDGKTLTYLSRNSIYKVNGTKSGAVAVEIVTDDVESFIAVDNGSAVYYINEDDEIYYQKGTGSPSLVTSDFSYGGYGMGYALYAGNTFYYISDDEVFVSSGSRGTRIGGIDGEPYYISASKYAIAISSDDDGDTLSYRSVDGKKFDLMHQS